MSFEKRGIGRALSFRRHRRLWPLMTAALGAGLLLYPMYHALEVDVWVGLVYTGLGLLLLSSGLDVWCAWRESSCLHLTLDDWPKN